MALLLRLIIKIDIFYAPNIILALTEKSKPEMIKKSKKGRTFSKVFAGCVHKSFELELINSINVRF